jgi:hypothetical protein
MPVFAGDIGAERETHVLLAMQKVEGSNPFSRLTRNPLQQRVSASRGNPRGFLFGGRGSDTEADVRLSPSDG